MVEMMPKYRWKISFDLKNTVIENGKELASKNVNIKRIGKNQVHGELFFETKYVDERIPGDAEEKLNEFLNIIALYQFGIGINSTFVLEKYDYKIDNSQELQDAGITVPGKVTLSRHTDAIFSKELLDKFPEKIKILNSSKNKHAVHNILRQYRIAFMQENPFIRYEQLWIAFMTLLDVLKPEPDWNDKKSIRDFANGNSSTLDRRHVKEIIDILSKSAWKYDNMILGPHIKNEKCGNWIDFFIKLKIPQWQKSETYSEELEEVIKSEQQTGNEKIYEKFKKILLCLYGIRNQLFHCTNYSISELNVGRMRLLCFALAVVLRISINSYIVKYTDLR